MKIRAHMDLSYTVLLLVLCSLNKMLVEATAKDVHKEPANHSVNHGDLLRQSKITMAQYRCFQRITESQHKTKTTAEPMCNMTWDGWLCWDETKAGVKEQNCPDYYDDFDTHVMAQKVCTETGEWARHPESNRTWTNYTNCKANFTHHGEQATMTHFYLVMIGHGLSLLSLLISLGIFFHFKSLSCQRITLHKNLFLSFMLNSIATVIVLTTLAKQGHKYADSISCTLMEFIHMYLMSCNYFWMLCEGIYLHTLIVVAVFAEEQHLLWYYLLGWGFPIMPAVIYSIARNFYYSDKCNINTSLLYIIHGPICAALVVNLFFLLNIVRVLITKLRVTHQAESSLYMRAVRATLILIPLLGIQFVLLPYKPDGHSEIYHYIMNILMHYQGLLVSTIFCFFNGEVQSILRRYWNQQRMQFAGTFANADIFRSASYVASSLTEVHRCYSIESHTEHMNGKSYSDIFRSDSPFV
ncbi:calcitonin gene-related peptide type 1 receptor [Oreochromis niloticus]|uniref:Calcitonin gene-related peptide type 1 receptor n=1 Tax=Oreochromis niloticus TaxID=8128 RepID=A0A669BMU1_ORENI|nr:calcitonin gene-related peptide type 1 receptor [Oreochromis niloticus]